MKLVAALVLTLFVTNAHADAPTYRDSATAIAVAPTVTITPAVGDTLIMLSVSTGHLNTDLAPGTVTDDNGGAAAWSYNNQSTWVRADGKRTKMQMWIRGTTLTNTNPTHVAVTMGNPTTTIATVVAVSGLVLLNTSSGSICGNNTPKTTKTNRLMKCNGAPANQLVAGSLPKVPKTGQLAPFLATSMAIATLANESNPAAVTAPTGFTPRVSVGVTVGSQSLGQNISTQDAGFNGYQVTWGSDTPTIGNATLEEIQPLQ
jgi:hypothetical protein